MLKKDKIRSGIVVGILLFVYHLLIFLIPFPKNAIFWMSYIFTILSIGVAVVSIYIAFVKKPDAKSKFYGFPIARIGVVYCLAQFIVGIVFMALGVWTPWWLVTVLYVIAFGVAVIGLVSAEAVVEQIYVQDETLKKDIALMRALQAKMKQMNAKCENAEIANTIKNLAEEFQYSDPVSSEVLSEIEMNLLKEVETLQQVMVSGDIVEVKKQCQLVSMILAERNQMCKLNK